MLGILQRQIKVKCDYLSFERAMVVMDSQGDCRNESERIDHLIPVMADFHEQMDFLKLIWKHLYNVWLS